MKSDLEGWRSWCKERAIITIIIFSFGTRQTKSSFPVRKLIEERRWNGGWLFTVSTCRGGGLWSHCTPIPGPLRYACSGWVVLKRLSVHFPTSFVSSPIRRWLSFRKKLLDFSSPQTSHMSRDRKLNSRVYTSQLYLKSHQGCSKQPASAVLCRFSGARHLSLPI